MAELWDGAGGGLLNRNGRRRCSALRRLCLGSLRHVRRQLLLLHAVDDCPPSPGLPYIVKGDAVGVEHAATRPEGPALDADQHLARQPSGLRCCLHVQRVVALLAVGVTKQVHQARDLPQAPRGHELVKEVAADVEPDALQAGRRAPVVLHVRCLHETRGRVRVVLIHLCR